MFYKMKRSFQSLILCTLFWLGSSAEEGRQGKMFSLFNVVKFKNTGCQSASDADLQGVCYTKQECEDGGGTTDGNCAAGFGSCCIFVISGTAAACGGAVAKNCSYIENPEFPATRPATAVGNCIYTINRCSSDVCQVRLDFKTTTRIGNPVAAAGTCGGGNTDQLAIAPGAQTTVGLSIPNLCGTLSGQHMYVDAGNAAALAATLTFTTIMGGTKTWRIKVSQIGCSSASRAPNGCLQYFTGRRSTVTSYNFDGTAACAPGCQLAAQDYNVCFRTEAGMCGINYTPTAVTAPNLAFQLMSMTANNQVKATQALECSNSRANANTLCGNAVADTCSFIQIPNSNAAANDYYCGMFLNVDVNAVVNGVVSSNMKPFRFRHAVYGISNALAGYSIDATQVPC